jgi:hypothetical protein
MEQVSMATKICIFTVLTFAFATNAASQQIRIERAVTPEPANIDELRESSKIKKLAPCKLPVVRSAEGWVRSFGPDEFLQIELAPDWTPQDPDTANSFFPEDPTASFRNANGDRIIIKRQAYTPIGLPFVKNIDGVVRPQSQCESISGKAGTFFSFYAAARGMSGRLYYTALGSGVTPAGKHYGIDLYAYSRAYLDTLAAIVAKSIIESRDDYRAVR